jgi:hypothetical protein
MPTAMVFSSQQYVTLKFYVFVVVHLVFYRKVTELKRFGVKVLLAIGGWNDSAGSKYSELVNDPSARSKFVDHVIGYLKQNDFDGLDFDWEYPKCWQVRHVKYIFIIYRRFQYGVKWRRGTKQKHSVLLPLIKHTKASLLVFLRKFQWNAQPFSQNKNVI